MRDKKKMRDETEKDKIYRDVPGKDKNIAVLWILDIFLRMIRGSVPGTSSVADKMLTKKKVFNFFLLIAF